MDDLLSTNRMELETREFRGLSCDGENIRQKEFLGCTFIKCTFRETVFREVRFRDCTFKGCDFSLADLSNCALIETRFDDSRLIGINWTLTAWVKKQFFKVADFYGCALNHATFMGLNLKKTALVHCVAHDVDFSEADLTLANCTHTDFANSRFQHTNLTEADFSGAINYTIAANLNTLKKTRFSLPEAMSLLYSLDIVLTDELPQNYP